ncbi:MAG: hypothetical protein LQ351_007262 [Letrouitia transgressa]|nr:MAG: hypothetical protein LQ351_007262 [Letrouitia transgressa]
MSQRPILKIRAPSLAQNPPPDVPASTTSTKTPKLKLKLSNAPTNISSETTTPATKSKAPRKPKTEKTARAPKSSSKKRVLDNSALGEDDEAITRPLPSTSEPSSKRLKLTQPSSKKRVLDNSTLSEDEETLPMTSEPSSKRLKLTAHKPPKSSPKNIRLKLRGRAPKRPIGVGYDSEASDAEKDPTLEEEIILRMTPGDDCDFLRQAITEKQLGSKEEDGVDVGLLFLREDGRRAVVSIQKRLYAACLVDLPCIIEGMKSWDKRAWYKTADICQMLLVLGRIENREDAMTHPLPKEVDEETWQYAHGLTPPMRWVRKRRFRKRIHNRTIEAVEEEVDRLLALDEHCIKSKCEVIDLDRLTHERSIWNEQGSTGAPASEDYGEDDAEGEEDIDQNFEPIPADEAKEDGAGDDEDELDAELKLAMEMEDEDEEQTATTATPLHPLASDNDTTSGAPTPGATKPSSGDEDSGDEEDEEEEEEDEDVDEDDDEDAKEKAQALKRQREEIADLEAVIQSQEQKIAGQTNNILKQKMITGLQEFKRELQVKLSAIGEGDED